jgi:CheY-like chemotaxis protein
MAAVPHILVADDDFALRRLLTLMLESGGYRVTTASNGAQAIAQMEAERPDLLCCDLMMPDIHGFQVLEAIKSRPHLAQTPVIIITAAGKEAEVKKALELGAARCVLKPFAKAHILGVIREVLSEVRTAK